MSQLQIQNARSVAYRALSLGTLLKRAQLEASLQDQYTWSRQNRRHKQATPEQHQENDALLQWVMDENITPHLSNTEYHLLTKTLGTWSERTQSTVQWRAEALGMTLWALNRLDICPHYDTPFDADTVLAPLDIYTSTIDFIWLASLRDDDSLKQRRDQAELWNWRSRARELKLIGVQPPAGVTFKEIIRVTAERAHKDRYIPRPIQGDFSVFDKAYVDLSVDEYHLTRTITYERNSALSWICETTSEWESIRIDRSI